MSLRLPVAALTVVLLVTTAACADVADRLDEVRSDSDEVTQTARFCLSLARAAAAIETGSPDTAADAAEEVLVHAPEDVREDARIVVEGIRRAEERGERAWEDPEVREAIERLRERTRDLCDPR
jgi:hypothetical protein